MGRREGRTDARASRLAFERFDQRRFLAADIGAGAEMDRDVEVKILDAADSFAEQVFAAHFALSVASSGARR